MAQDEKKKDGAETEAPGDDSGVTGTGSMGSAAGGVGGISGGGGNET